MARQFGDFDELAIRRKYLDALVALVHFEHDGFHFLTFLEIAHSGFAGLCP